MQLTTLLITLTLTLQLGASTKKPNANANASAAASASALVLEQDLKGAAGKHPYELAFALHRNSVVQMDPTNRSIVTRALQDRSLFERYLIAAISGLNIECDILASKCLNSPDEVRSVDNIQHTFAHVARATLLERYGAANARAFEPHTTADADVKQYDAVKAATERFMPRELAAIIAAYSQPFRVGIDFAPRITNIIDTRYGIIRGCQVKQSYAMFDNVIDFKAKIDALKPTLPIISICLWGNLIPVIPRGMCADMVDLEELDVSHNRLRKVEEGAFAGAIHLRELNLADNFLTDIPDDIYSLPNLRGINLQGNPLSEGAKKKYQAWQERRKKLAEGAAAGNGAATPGVHANAAATAGKSS